MIIVILIILLLVVFFFVFVGYEQEKPTVQQNDAQAAPQQYVGCVHIVSYHDIYKPLHYGDWMLSLEKEAQRRIAGNNSPPNVMESLYG